MLSLLSNHTVSFICRLRQDPSRVVYLICKILILILVRSPLPSPLIPYLIQYESVTAWLVLLAREKWFCIIVWCPSIPTARTNSTGVFYLPESCSQRWRWMGRYIKGGPSSSEWYMKAVRREVMKEWPMHAWWS